MGQDLNPISDSFAAGLYLTVPTNTKCRVAVDLWSICGLTVKCLRQEVPSRSVFLSFLGQHPQLSCHAIRAGQRNEMKERNFRNFIFFFSLSWPDISFSFFFCKSGHDKRKKEKEVTLAPHFSLPDGLTGVPPPLWVVTYGKSGQGKEKKCGPVYFIFPDSQDQSMIAT